MAQRHLYCKLPILLQKWTCACLKDHALYRRITIRWWDWNHVWNFILSSMILVNCCGKFVALCYIYMYLAYTLCYAGMMQRYHHPPIKQSATEGVFGDIVKPADKRSFDHSWQDDALPEWELGGGFCTILALYMLTVLWACFIPFAFA